MKHFIKLLIVGLVLWGHGYAYGGWTPIVDDLKKAGGDVSRESKKAGGDVARETKKALKTVEDYLRQNLVPPIVNEYFIYLRQQADGRWKQVPDRLRLILESDDRFAYRRVMLSKVRYAENINTVHRQAITVGNLIYFTGKSILIQTAISICFCTNWSMWNNMLRMEG